MWLVKTSDARPACLMSWGLQVVEGEEMAQGVQPDGQNVVVAVAEGVGRPVPPSCTRLTMTIGQTCRYHLGGLEQDLGKAGGRQPSGCSLFAWLQGRRGLELKEYLPGRELHRNPDDGIPEGHKGYSSHPDTTRRHFSEKVGPPA